jgi:RecA/RadA recombinase
MSDTEAIKRELLRDKVPKETSKPTLSTGSTLLNLAISDKSRGGFMKGCYYHIVGDSDSGKTFVSMTAFAEATLNDEFQNYRFIHDNTEDGALMDVEQFFGKRVNAKIEPPAGTRKEPIYSSTVEEFYFHLDDAFRAKKPFIYILDSLDALDSKPDQKKFQQHKTAHNKPKKEGVEEKEAGSYGMAKAKLNASGLRTVFNKLKRSGSILLVISQAKVDMRFGMPPGSKTFSGGTSLKFYAHAQIWTSPAGPISEKIQGRPRNLGVHVKAVVKKNRHTGRKAGVRIPIYWSYGIDDLGSCIDFMVEEKEWTKSKGLIHAKELSLVKKKEDLIAHIEANDLEGKLRSLVGKKWLAIKQACKIKRKRRYG